MHSNAQKNCYHGYYCDSITSDFIALPNRYSKVDVQSMLNQKSSRRILHNATLRTESPSIFLGKSGRGRNLCRHPQQFILSMLQIQIFLRRQSNRYRSIHCVCQQM